MSSLGVRKGTPLSLEPVATAHTTHRLPLTPPVTPIRGRTSSLESTDKNIQPFELRKSSVKCRIDAVQFYTVDGILLCPFDVEVVRDNARQEQLFGSGAWSNVLKGTCHHKTETDGGNFITSTSRMMLPPPVLVAVKKPSRKDAVPILKNEAKILTHLRQLDQREEHVASFLGFLPDTSLVLMAHPLSLESYIATCAINAQEHFKLDDMYTPIVGGLGTWLALAASLISTLDWLHSDACVVHGDIKPGNVLLRPAGIQHAFPYTPLLIDFSSSQRLDTSEVQPNTLSAITREYTAPELLSSAVLRDPNSSATTATDVFSMAVTLLVAATGELSVYPGCSVFQRQALATQGWGVLEAVRGFGSTRVPKTGLVVKVLERAVLKANMGRVSAGKWLQVVEDLRRDAEF